MKNLFKKISLVIATLAIALLLGMNFLPLSVNASSDQKHVFDEQDLLTDEEEEKINELAEKYSNKRKVDILIYIVQTGPDYTVSSYSNKIYSEHTMSTDATGVVIYTHDPTTRNTWLEGYDSAIEHLSHKQCTSICEKAKRDLRNNDYYKAYKKIITTSNKYLKAKPGTNADSIVYQWWFQLIIAFAIGGVSVIIMAYNSGGKVTTNSTTYLDSSNSRILNSHDHYLRTTTTRVKRESSSSGGSSGGSGGGGSSSGGGCSY